MKRLSPILGLAVAASVIVPASTPAMAADDHRHSAASSAVFSKLPTSNYRLSAKFGQRGSYWSSGRHTGLDFAAPRGTKVKAVADGKVVFSGWAGAYGKAVIVKHKGGKRSLYAHMSKRKVGKGRHVQAGQKIGRVGGTGNVTGPHLHFEVRTKNGQKVDPRQHLRGE